MHTYLHIGLGFAIIAILAYLLVSLYPELVSSEMRKEKARKKQQNQKLYRLKKRKESKQKREKSSSW